MFRFNKIVFVISNFIISFIFFIIIFKFRYSWINFIGIEKRTINFETLIYFIVYSFVLIIIMISFRLYEVNKINKITETIPLIFFVSFLTMSIFGVFFYITKLQFARFVFFIGFIVIPIIILVYNKMIFLLLIRNKKTVNLLYFGNEKNYFLLNDLIKEYSKWFSMNVDMILLNDDIRIFNEKIKNNDILIVDTDQYFNKDQINILNNYEINGGKIYSLIDIFEYFDQSLPAEIIQNSHYERFSSYKLDSFYNKYMKRFLDIIISIFLLIIFFPLIIILIFFIKATSKGKIFYKQSRMTVNNKKFFIYKFRSMKETDDKIINFTVKNDKRLTFIGKIIRPLRIDEIPQLINVLKGDMSLIGPRPERLELIEEIIKKYPLFKKRLLIKPGITGWAQVKYPYVNQIDQMNKKLSYDLYYINNISFSFDLIIFLYTIETIFFKKGGF
ncbi:MAG: sugar transferase [Spirochaetes bacterium]|nr:sugar transferase [Spirochaetota bacterium]